MLITFLSGRPASARGIFTEELSLVTCWGVAKRSGQLLDAAKVAGAGCAPGDKRRRAAAGYQQQRPLTSSSRPKALLTPFFQPR